MAKLGNLIDQEVVYNYKSVRGKVFKDDLPAAERDSKVVLTVILARHQGALYITHEQVAMLYDAGLAPSWYVIQDGINEKIGEDELVNILADYVEDPVRVDEQNGSPDEYKVRDSG